MAWLFSPEWGPMQLVSKERERECLELEAAMLLPDFPVMQPPPLSRMALPPPSQSQSQAEANRLVRPSMAA